jgi:hypothetical protein
MATGDSVDAVGSVITGAGIIGNIPGLEWLLPIAAGAGAIYGSYKTVKTIIGSGSTAQGSGTMTTGTATGTSVTTGASGVAGGLSYGGPGVPEFNQSMVTKQWKTKAFAHDVGEYWVYFFRLVDGRVACWNERKHEMSIWKPKKNMVLSANPRLPDLLKFSKVANRMLFKLDKQADKARRQFGVVRVVHETTSRKR